MQAYRQIQAVLHPWPPCADHKTQEDPAIRRVYADALEEAGLLARAEEQRKIADFLAAYSGAHEDDLPPKVRSMVRSRAGYERSACPIRVEDGDSRPIASGEGAYHTFRRGGRCTNPGWALRNGHKIDYHRSTLCVHVGLTWLLREVFFS